MGVKEKGKLRTELVKSKPARSSRQSYDEASQHRLWEVSEQLTGLAATTTAA